MTTLRLLPVLPILLQGACAARLVQQLEAEVVALHQRADALQSRAAACGDADAAEALHRQLVQLFPTGGPVVVAIEGGLVVLRADTASLVTGDVVSPAGLMNLDLLSSVLHGHPDLTARITARSAGADANAGWPAARAIADTLSRRFGLPAARVVPGATAGQADRVEILLAPGLLTTDLRATTPAATPSLPPPPGH